MRKPGGYLIGVGDGAPDEADTFTCHHCQHITIVRPGCDPSELGGHCKICDHLICSRCVGKGCTPWEKQMEKIEARAAALRSYGM